MLALVSSKKVIPQFLQNVKQSKGTNGSVKDSSSVCASRPELQWSALSPRTLRHTLLPLASPTPSRAYSLTLLAVDNNPENPSTHSPSSITPASQFFTLISITVLVMKAWFHCVAAAFGDPAPAQTVAGLMLLMLVLYAGYKSRGRQWFKWISYINPIWYGFEGLMSNEFHTLNGTCSNLVSSGTRHANVSLTNQVCGTVGSISSQSTMDGNRFIAISYDYSYSNIWQNFSIIIGFGIAFLTALLVFAKYNRSLSGGTSAMPLKQEVKAPVMREAQGKVDTVDEEIGVPESRDATEKICGESGLRSNWTSLFP